ncbi:endolytic transglycosylase MltG [Erythrobacteraceae bacterium CFH 75059]|uniref:endolytic transglycosylase MltG n=1 Tax=Qipengyuania thermophila TaxID=2509361 RepID=UPI0010206E49|nr:endolytic transglycosylase MltG [Qipengyuania thermophila]TCD05046.1 endolytic transglycosylase MltG [Erythrobacteraceae bacterium CFH 75059]
MARRLALAGVAGALVLLAGLLWLVVPWYASGPAESDTTFTVAEGASLRTVAAALAEAGLISSADGFVLRARVLGGSGHVRAGEFALPAGASPATILDTLQSGAVIRRLVTIPEGMPSVLVHERLMAEPLLTGSIPVPAEGSVLPDSYAFERGETRQAVLARMQRAMQAALSEEWERRSARAVVSTPAEAVILASVVEKETGLASERPMIAGALSNRLRTGMRLDADATTIYPITRGRPLGRMIRRSELDDPNPYNTRAIAGLPAGPITNPGRDAIRAVLNPADTDALFYVADGSGGHVFARTLSEHNANVARWREIRRQRGI